MRRREGGPRGKVRNAGFECAFICDVARGLQTLRMVPVILREGGRTHGEQRARNCCDFERHPDSPETNFDDCENARARKTVDENP